MKFKFIDSLPGSERGKATRPNAVLAEFAEALKANPGMWAAYPRPLTQNSRYRMAYEINRGRGPASFVANSEGSAGFEAANRGEHLYVRYVKERS